MEGAARDLAANEDVKEFYLGLSSGGRKSFRDVKHYRRRKRDPGADHAASRAPPSPRQSLIPRSLSSGDLS